MKKETVNMSRLSELRRKGYGAKTIARVLGVSTITVRTIIGNGDKCHAGDDGCLGSDLKKCA